MSFDDLILRLLTWIVMVLSDYKVGNRQPVLILFFLETQILVHSGKLQEAEILQRKILHILELLQVSFFSIFRLLIEPTF